MPSTYSQIEEALAARIIALDADPYTQGNVVAAEWKETSQPLNTIRDSSALLHLNFDVWTQGAPNTEDHRDSGWTNDPDDVDNTAWVEARIKVQFTYHIRAGVQKADHRLANDAAVDVTRALMAAWTADEVANFGPVNVLLIDGLQPRITPDGEWILITQDYAVQFELQLVPTP